MRKVASEGDDLGRLWERRVRVVQGRGAKVKCTAGAVPSRGELPSHCVNC